MYQSNNTVRQMIPEDAPIDLVNGTRLTAFEIVIEQSSYTVQGFVAGHDRESEWRVFVPISAVLHVTITGDSPLIPGWAL